MLPVACHSFPHFLHFHHNFFDVPALFSNGRVNSNDIPEGIYRYELQGASYDPGYPLYVKESVGVNHAGTVLTTVPVTVENTDSLRLGDGLDFSGGTQMLAEYQKIMAGRNRTSDLELVQSTMGRNNEAVYLNGAENRYVMSTLMILWKKIIQDLSKKLIIIKV